MKKSIVLDLDGVIADIDTPIDNYLRYACGVDEDYSEWLIYDTKDTEAIKLFSNPIFWKNIKPFEDAWHKCNEWFSEDIDIYIVTARNKEVAAPITQQWLDEWNIGHNKVYFSNFGKKIDIIKEINPMFVVEDNFNEIKILEKSGIKCYLRKAWYNKKYWTTLDSVDSLYDIRLD